MTSGDEKNYGEPIKHDKSFRGPSSKRGCTDVLCLLIFFVFVVLWGFIGYYANRGGDFQNILVPRDSIGQKCGVDSPVKDKKFLVFFDIKQCVSPTVAFTGCDTPQVCVKECPKTNFLYTSNECNSKTFADIKSKMICNYNVVLNSCEDIDNAVNKNQCAQYFLRSEPLFKFCLTDVLLTREICSKSPQHNSSSMPNEKDCDSINQMTGAVKKMINGHENVLNKLLIDFLGYLTTREKAEAISQAVVEDLVATKYELLIGIGLSAVACFVFIAMMRFIAGPIVWLSILGVLALLGVGVFFSYRQYDFLKNNADVRINVQYNLVSLANSYFKKAETWLWLMIILSIVLVVLLLILLVLRKRIVIAVALIKEGSKAVSSNLSTLAFPFFPWLLQMLFIVYGLYVFGMLTTVGDRFYKVSGLNGTVDCFCPSNYANGLECTPDQFNMDCKNSKNQQCTEASCLFTEMKVPEVVQYFQAWNLVGFFWMLFFISAFGEMVLAGVFATWYWTKNEGKQPFFSLTESIHRTVRFHLGTIAFGSLIITICRLIQIALEYIDRKLKKFDNKVVKAIMCCCKCFFFCLENFLRFLNKNAYIMTAIHGTSFCTSARNAFNLMMRNILRAFAVDKVSDFLFFLSKILVSLGVAACMYTYLGQSGIKMNYIEVPCIILAIFTYLISSVFFSVYSMAVDTLFLCFLEDSERNDGSAERPYAMSRDLRKVLGKKNRELE